MPSLKAYVLLLCALSSGCAATLIPNTDVEDNSQNRAVVNFVETYRHAVEERDIARLMRLASPSYFDDNGTPSGDDDVDYEGLAHKLAQWPSHLLAARYEIRYRRVTFRDNGRVYVDFTYTGSFRYATPDGGRWERRLADDRIVLEKNGDSFRIRSGM